MAEDPFTTTRDEQQYQQPHIYRPIPRRNFTTQTHESDSPGPNLYAQSTPPISPNARGSSDFLTQLNARLLHTRNGSNGHLYNQYEGSGEGSIHKNKSFLNMTTSTLYGIYDDVGPSTAGERSEAETPWGTGAETPARGSIDGGHVYGLGLGSSGLEREYGLGSPDGGLKMKCLQRSARRDTMEKGMHVRSRSRHGSQKQRQGIWKLIFMLGKLSALFAFGVTYGVIVSQLNNTRNLAAARPRGADEEGPTYFASWGIAGIVLGSLLPYVDLLWEGEQSIEREDEAQKKSEGEIGFGEQLNEVVRSVGAFVGIAFAIRRLPWQSTLQLTVTLALVNPALWYILDRSKTGLTVSTLVTSILTTFIFLANPDALPSPALPARTNTTHIHSTAYRGGTGSEGELFAGVVSYESLAVATWVGSVLFCSCVCFGTIGRRLAILDEWGLGR